MKWIKYLINLVKSIFSDNEECDACSEKKCEILTNGKRYALIVGMEVSKWGSCAGSNKDSETMKGLISNHLDSSHIVKLNNAQATKAQVVKSLKEQIAKVPEDGLFIFTYSGHGGQMEKGGTSKDETDGMDEFLCLYDDYLIDNDLWTIFSQCKGRIFVVFDCCHSGTMYRLPAPQSTGTPDEPERKPLEQPFFKRFEGIRAVGGPRMFVISGCGEETVSWGDATNGGVLSTAMKKCYNKCLSYSDWWSKTRADATFKKVKQVPIATKIGAFDLAAKIFN